MCEQKRTTFTGTLWSFEGRILARRIQGFFDPPALGELCWQGRLSGEGEFTEIVSSNQSLIVRSDGCGGTPIRLYSVHPSHDGLRFQCEHPIEPGPVTYNR